MSDAVTLKLSNPIEAVYAARLGLGDRDYRTHDEVTVPLDIARSIIAAGYAQVDPEDPQAVAEALGIHPARASIPGAATRTTPAEAAFLRDEILPDKPIPASGAPSVEPPSGSGTTPDLHPAADAGTLTLEPNPAPEQPGTPDEPADPPHPPPADDTEEPAPPATEEPAPQPRASRRRS